MSDKDLSRRDLFTFWRKLPGPAAAPAPAAAPSEAAPEGAAPLRAQLLWQTCLAYKDTPCDACHRICPVDQAIRIDDHGHPRLDRYRCNGCGECVKVCPTEPPSLLMAPLC